jgi:hypothetical protein
VPLPHGRVRAQPEVARVEGDQGIGGPQGIRGTARPGIVQYTPGLLYPATTWTGQPVADSARVRKGVDPSRPGHRQPGHRPQEVLSHLIRGHTHLARRADGQDLKLHIKQINTLAPKRCPVPLLYLLNAPLTLGL